MRGENGINKAISQENLRTKESVTSSARKVPVQVMLFLLGCGFKFNFFVDMENQKLVSIFHDTCYTWRLDT